MQGREKHPGTCAKEISAGLSATASLRNGSTPVSLLGHWLEAACGKRGFGANVRIELGIQELGITGQLPSLFPEGTLMATIYIIKEFPHTERMKMLCHIFLRLRH